MLFVFNFAPAGYAQSLGDPIVHITFGSGTRQYAGPLAADSGSTTYTYVAKSPEDNYYTIANSTLGMNTGWVYTTDHTGDPNGYMMIVNASITPGVFYTRKVSGLCGSTTYQFSAFIKNIIARQGAILPNVTFSIEATDGTVLGKGNTGDISLLGSWIDYPFTFTTPDNTQDVVIKMINNAPGGGGNDIAIDDIVFRPYGPLLRANVDQSNSTFCESFPQPITIKSLYPLAPGYMQKLQLLVNGVWKDQGPSSTASSFTVTSPSVQGSYSYRMVAGFAANINSTTCVVASNTLDIMVLPSPPVDFQLPAVCLADSYAKFTPIIAISAGTTYLWNFGDPNASVANPDTSTQQNPAHKYTEARLYQVTLTVTPATGCPTIITKPFMVNGSVPVADFTVLNKTSLCSNREVFFSNQSTVDAGKITQIIWIYDTNDPSKQDTDNNPGPGKLYRHLYPPFSSPATRNYQVRMFAYSGGVCVSQKDQTITLLAKPIITFNAPDSVCLNNGPIQFTGQERSGINGSGVYEGRGVTPSGLFDPAAAGVGAVTVKYIYTVATTACADTITRVIIVKAIPAINAGPDVKILAGGTIQLHATATGDKLTYKWLPVTGLSNSTIPDPFVTLSQDLTYTVTVTNGDGCSVSDDIQITTLEAPVIPNTFTPNHDGVNDKWDIKYLDTYPSCTVDIFNRNGQKVFSSVGYKVAWDGQSSNGDLPFGVYYYIIDFKNGRKATSGYVTIVR